MRVLNLFFDRPRSKKVVPILTSDGKRAVSVTTLIPLAKTDTLYLGGISVVMSGLCPYFWVGQRKNTFKGRPGW